jgi:oxalate decarboxylase/phosphoglucose isomerase-like protein (cupin superfamily)
MESDWRKFRDMAPKLRRRYLVERNARIVDMPTNPAIHAKRGDFIHIPRGVVHSIKNEGTKPARALVVISPAGPTGMQQFFEESFTPTTDCNATLPPITDELMKRMMASAAKNGLEWIKPDDDAA